MTDMRKETDSLSRSSNGLWLAINGRSKCAEGLPQSRH